MPSSHLILCRPFCILPPIPPSIRAFSNESTLFMRWPKYWSFSFSIRQDLGNKVLTLPFSPLENTVSRCFLLYSFPQLKQLLTLNPVVTQAVTLYCY